MIVAIGIIGLGIVVGVFLLHKRAKSKEKAIAEVKQQKDRVNSIIDNYFRKLYRVSYDTYWHNKIGLFYSEIEIVGAYKNRMDTIITFEGFGLTEEDKSIAETIILDRVKEQIKPTTKSSFISQLILLNELTELNAEKDALLKAQNDFDLKGKDEAVYTEMTKLHTTIYNHIVSRFMSRT